MLSPSVIPVSRPVGTPVNLARRSLACLGHPPGQDAFFQSLDPCMIARTSLSGSSTTSGSVRKIIVARRSGV